MKTDIQIAFEARRCVMRWSDGNAGDYPAERLVDDLEELLSQRPDQLSKPAQRRQTRERFELGLFIAFLVALVILVFQITTTGAIHVIN